MRKPIQLIVGLTSFVAALSLVVGVAYAHAPTITITGPADNAVIETATFPKVVAVTGSISHLNETNNGQHNLCSINEFRVTVDDGVTVTEIGTKTWNWGNNVANCPASENWAYDFTALEPGVYTIVAKAKHSSDWGEAESAFEVVEEQTVIVSFPAAPSVAAQLLSDADIPARYGSGKTGGNHIADVAAEMNKTPGTDFQGVSKRDVQAYAEKVADYLRTKTPVSANV